MPQSYKNNYLRKNNNIQDEDLKFLNWMDKIEVYVKEKINVYLLDLQDEMYRYNFESGMKYRQMAKLIIKNYHNIYNNQ